MTKSRTIKFNAAMMTLDTVLLYLLGMTDMLSQVVSPQQFAFVILGLGVLQKIVNMYLRTVTTQPLSERG